MYVYIFSSVLVFKLNVKQTYLCIICRLEWKKIRNRYLDNQKAKMKQLKQFLHKKRFTNHGEVKQKGEQRKLNGSGTNTNTTAKEKQEVPFTPGVIVKIQLSESSQDVKKIKVSSAFRVLYSPPFTYLFRYL